MEPSPETATSPDAAVGFTPVVPDPKAPTTVSMGTARPAPGAALMLGSGPAPEAGSPRDLQGYSSALAAGVAGGGTSTAGVEGGAQPAGGRGADPAQGGGSPEERVRALDAEVLELRQRLSSALRVRRQFGCRVRDGKRNCWREGGDEKQLEKGILACASCQAFGEAKNEGDEDRILRGSNPVSCSGNRTGGAKFFLKIWQKPSGQGMTPVPRTEKEELKKRVQGCSGTGVEGWLSFSSHQCLRRQKGAHVFLPGAEVRT